MKAKKLAGLILGLAMASTLASCGENTEQTSAAAKKALSMNIANVSGTPLLADTTATLEGDSNQAITVTTKQVVKVEGNSYTAELNWTWDEKYNDKASLEVLKDDETHKKIAIAYPAKAEVTEDTDLTFAFSVTAKVGSQTASANYNVVLTPATLIFDFMTIADLYKKSDDGTTFAFIDQTTGYIKENHSQGYYYVRIPGKLIYKSPDSNWGLLADGDKVIQLYRLDECGDDNLAVVGEYLTVYGEIGPGYGNVQLSYISKIEVLSDHSDIAEPVDITLPSGFNTSTSADYKPFNSGISNAVTTLTGKIVSGDLTSFTGKVRFTFEIEIATDTNITVAYDYHVKTDDIVSSYTSVLAGGIGTNIKVRGTLRWSNADGTHTIGGAGGWTITPFEASGMSAA